MKGRVLVSVFLVALVFISPKGASGGSADSPSEEERQMGLADRFLMEGEYFRAITEYKRFLYSFPGSKRAEEALFRIGEGFFLGGQYRDAVSHLERMLRNVPEGEFHLKARYLLSRSLMESRRNEEARAVLHTVLRAAPAGPLRDMARYRLAETYIREEKWREAIDALEGVEPDSPFRRETLRYASDLRGIDGLPVKSPEMAGLLSALMPGAGHLYCERPLDGLVAFLVNAAFIAGAVEAFRKDEKGLGIALSLIEGTWYIGTIFSAVTSAHKINRDKKRDYLERIRIDMGTVGEGRNGLLGLRVTF